MNEATSIVAAAPSAQGALYYRHTLAVRVMHWINVVADDVVHERTADLQCASGALLGQVVLLRPAAVARNRRARRRGGRDDGCDAHLRPRVRYHGRPRTVARRWPVVRAGVPRLDGDSLASVAVDGALVAFLLRLGLRDQRPVLRFIRSGADTSRDLAPTGGELRTIGQSIRDHLRFRHPSGEAAKRYNVLQKIAYLVVIFVLLPLIVMMGLAMSPRLDAVFTGWVDLVGGRQSARTIHFVVAWLLVAFVLIHVFQVIVTGVWNNLRSMITGRYRVPTEAPHD